MKYVFIALLLCSAALSCSKKDSVETVLNEAPVTAGTVLKTGSFTTNSKNTSGTIKVVQNANNSKSLVFENFATGSGPDVRVWLSTNTSGSAYVEIGALKATSGNFSYDLATGVDFTTNNKVLIWCEDFNVLFGHATLQ